MNYHRFGYLDSCLCQPAWMVKFNSFDDLLPVFVLSKPPAVANFGRVFVRTVVARWLNPSRKNIEEDSLNENRQNLN